MNRAERRKNAKENKQLDTMIKHQIIAPAGEFAAYFTKQHKKQKRNR